jgi:hypothetical protein
LFVTPKPQLPPSRFKLVSMVLHELTHQLELASFFL